MLVGIFSARDATAKREAVRLTWEIPSGVTAKFVLCAPGPSGASAGTPPGSLTRELIKESETYDDLMLISCEEGYAHGLLTRKVVAFFTAVHERFRQTRLIYKVDDDTVANLRALMDQLRVPGRFVYAGSFNRWAKKPTHDSKSRFYEPPEVFNGTYYPPAALGGTGYVLSWPLVDYILQSGVTARNLLWNEDRAVGVWVDLASKAGLSIAKVDVPGAQGYGGGTCSSLRGVTRSTLKLTLIHHVAPRQMLCFHAAWKADEDLGKCFCKRDF